MIVQMNKLFLDASQFLRRNSFMSTPGTQWCWRKDLAAFRGLSEWERGGFLLVLEWFENFRLRHQLEAGRESARLFWRSEVQREDREREDWQLTQ